jgi:hypothetical protein
MKQSKLSDLFSDVLGVDFPAFCDGEAVLKEAIR